MPAESGTSPPCGLKFEPDESAVKPLREVPRVHLWIASVVAPVAVLLVGGLIHDLRSGRARSVVVGIDAVQPTGQV